MRGVNNVNDLSGTEWLKNAVNFWMFDYDDIDRICDRFKSFCYKDRTGNGYITNTSSYEIKNSDFSFNYIKSIDDLKKSISVIELGEYNSYHVFFYSKEIIDEIFITPIITKTLDVDGIEYRGKIVIKINNSNKLYYSLLFLNRRNTKNSINLANIEKIEYESSNSYVIESRSKIDKIGLKHPAPYSYIDINKIANIEGINNKVILDPFLGVGSTIIGTYENNTNIGIELNKTYIDLIKERFEFLKLPEDVYKNSTIICGDSLAEVDNISKKIDCVITSPPYFNILKNKTSGVRTDNSQSRQGIEYYSDDNNDIGNINEYEEYLNTMSTLFRKIKKKMNDNGEVYLIISDFTVNKREKDIHSDFVKLLCNNGYIYKGTSYILQNQKAIYPFGYPYKLVINHIYQYIVKFKVK